MHKQCVPGSFLPTHAREPGNKATWKLTFNSEYVHAFISETDLTMHEYDTCTVSPSGLQLMPSNVELVGFMTQELTTLSNMTPAKNTTTNHKVFWLQTKCFSIHHNCACTCTCRDYKQLSAMYHRHTCVHADTQLSPVYFCRVHTLQMFFAHTIGGLLHSTHNSASIVIQPHVVT